LHDKEPGPASHTWIFDLLFAGSRTVTWAPAGKLPPGFDRVEQYGMLPATAGRRFVVPLATRAGASSVLTSYNALRSIPRRMVRHAFGLGLRTGVAQPFIRDRIDIGVTAGASPDQLAADLLTVHLRQKFGWGPLMVAFGAGDGPYRKPVLQVFSTTGTPLAYVKVGWNDWTAMAVRTEAAALRLAASRAIRTGVPVLLGHSRWRGFELLVTAPLPGGVRTVGLRGRPDTAALREISQLSARHSGELAASLWWQSLLARIGSGLAGSPAASQLAVAAAAIERRYGDTTLEYGSWHGDLVPWNMARRGRSLYVWDWESFAPAAPLGFDALHYHFQVAFVARGRPLPVAAAEARQRARPSLHALGVPADRQGLVASLHLIELFARHEKARNSSGGLDSRFYPGVADLLEQTLAAPASSHGVGRAA
jgi:hypothetical protein